MKILFIIKPNIVTSYASFDPPNKMRPMSQMSRTSG
jgi:hypothetical protein